MTRSKICKIELLPRYSPAGSSRARKFPRATETTVTDLECTILTGLKVRTLAITTLVTRAFGNPEPMVDEKEVWHPDEIGLDVFTRSKDARRETVTTAEIKAIVTKKQPDQRFFEIPPD